MTLGEYLNTPESVLPTELAGGVLRVADAPLVSHQAVVIDFLMALMSHVRAESSGEVWIAPLDVILDPDRPLVVQPDLLFVSNERRHIVTDRIHGAPDMVLEVLSPHPRIGRLNEHIDWFARYGVRECWLYHQGDRALTIIGFTDGKVAERVTINSMTPIRSAVLPGFQRTTGSIVRWA
jgi:Uma2 family endonuclease